MILVQFLASRKPVFVAMAMKRPAAATPTKTTPQKEKKQEENEASTAPQTPAPVELDTPKTPIRGKAKAKASPKVGPKTKAKAACKKAAAKKKAVTQTVLKKPSCKQQGGGNANNKGGTRETLQQQTEKWTLAAQETQVASEEDGEAGVLRDAGKAKKYKKLSDAGAIPKHILDLIDVQSKKRENPRAEKSKLINNLFSKNEKGGYDLQAHKPVFEQARVAYYKRYGKDEALGLPKDVFLWQTFHGNEVALEKAIAKGSVTEYKKDGVEFCSFKRNMAGVESGANNDMKVSGGLVDLKQKQYDALSRAFSSLALSLEDSDDDGTAKNKEGEASSSKKGPQELENCELTKNMADVLADAKSAHEKLYAQAMKLLAKCSSDTDKKKFKDTVLKIKQWIQKNENVLTWKDSWSF